MIEKQVIVNWYTPEEKLPPDGQLVVGTVSGKSRDITFDHAMVILEYFDGEGWFIEDHTFVDPALSGAWLTVHAWADLEPYKG